MLVRFLRKICGSRPYLYGALAGGAMVAAVYVVDAVMAQIHLRPEATILDDLLLGALTAALVVTLELQHQREMRRQQERMAIVIEMNHHIRNALQTIVYVNSKMDDRDAETIHEATDRIEWALREILPGTMPAPARVMPKSSAH
jgi:hypothetical protein